MKERNGINEINKACKSVIKLTDEDFMAVEEVIKGQLEYTHPFKMATAKSQHDLGEYNTRVVKALKNLRSVILRGAEI